MLIVDIIMRDIPSREDVRPAIKRKNDLTQPARGLYRIRQMSKPAQMAVFTMSRAQQPPGRLPWVHDSAESAADQSIFVECCNPQNLSVNLPQSIIIIMRDFNALFISNDHCKC